MTTDKPMRKRKRPNLVEDYLDHEDIFYIRQHLAAGVAKERIAANVYCDVAHVEAVEGRKKTG